MLFRKVVKFKFNHENYQMFLSPQNAVFYLKINDKGKYEYLTIDEYIKVASQFKRYPLIKNAEKDNEKRRFNFTPKVIFKNGLKVISPLVLTVMLSSCMFNPFDLNYLPFNNDPSDYSYYDNQPAGINDYNYDNQYANAESQLNFEVKDLDEDLEVETVYDNTIGSSYYVYDSAYIDKILSPKKVTKNDLIDLVNNNSNISEKYKVFLREYIDNLYRVFPNNNYRVFYENLKDLKIHECEDNFEMFEHSLSFSSYACYVPMENTVYTSNEYKYEKKTWEYQVIMHEFSHVLRTYRNEQTRQYIEFADLVAGNVITEEALNSIFTVALFDYEEPDIAYQYQSNMYKLIIESMDNYDLNDYVNHSSSYFAHKLDEFTGHHNYASVMFRVIDAQYSDFHNEYIEIDQSEFYPLYEWISDIYYKNRLNSSMSYDEMKNVTQELIDKLIFDVPDEYHLDTNYFYTYLDQYIQNHNLGSSRSK